MLCIKCHKDIPDGSLFCMFCGKKQTVTKSKTHKRLSGSGTISKDSRYKNQWIAHGPATSHGAGRKYLGAYATRAEAQAALDDYLKRGRPDLYNATLQQIYEMWSERHFKEISEVNAKTYRSLWKRFENISHIKMSEIRAADFQAIVDEATSESTAGKLIAIAAGICRIAYENDIILKDYSKFIKRPKYEKHVKISFSKEDIAKLWNHSDDKNVQAVLIMIYTGFRIGEIISLKKSDIHLDDGYMVGGEKTEAGRNRIVPIPPNIPEIKDFITAQIKRTPESRLYPLSTASFRSSVFNPALYVSDIPEKYTPHCTRHTFASLSAEAGMRPENLQKIIGHADYSTTANIYVHQDIDALIADMAKLKK